MRRFESVAIACSIVLHFDGSLRYPKDEGFRIPTEQAPLAACAASIQWDSNEDGMLSLGGKLLDCSTSTTSAEVEYQGLMLGLEGLLLHVIQDNDWLPDSSRFQIDEPVLVQVCGDCKTVIQQMNNLSHARKLEPLHNRAGELLQELKSRQPKMRVQFRHIPRIENQLCDRLAVRIVKENTRHSYHSALTDLQSLCDAPDSKMAHRFVDQYLSLELNAAPFSKRPMLYRLVARVFFQEKDFVSLVLLAERWEAELKETWPLRENHLRDRYIVEATVYQIVGLKAQKKRARQASIRQRRKRFLLGKWSAFCQSVEESLAQDSRLVLDKWTKTTDKKRQEEESTSTTWPRLVDEWYSYAQHADDWASNRVQWLEFLPKS